MDAAMTTDLLKDLLLLLPESFVLEDDNTFIDDDQSMPAPAEMVEWVTLTFQIGVDLLMTLTLIWVYIQLYILIYFI